MLRGSPIGERELKLREEIRASGVKPRLTFLFPLSRERESALNLLTAEEPNAEEAQRLINESSDPHVLAAALTTHPNAEITPEQLKELTRHPSRWVHEAAKQISTRLTKNENSKIQEDAKPARSLVMFKRKGNKRTLFSRKPLFATGYPRELINRLKKLEEITKKLKKKYGEGFTGVTVFGSTSKGYFKKGSDLDYAIIAKDYAAAREFKRLAKNENLQLCYETYLHPEHSRQTAFGFFHGLFFGDRKQLRQAQKKAIQKINQRDWDSIVYKISTEEATVKKILNRFGISKEEYLKFALAAELARVPPASIEEMRRIMKVKSA